MNECLEAGGVAGVPKILKGLKDKPPASNWRLLWLTAGFVQVDIFVLEAFCYLETCCLSAVFGCQTQTHYPFFLHRAEACL